MAGGGLFAEHLDVLAAEEVSAEQQHQENLARIMPNTPQEMLRSIHDLLAEKDPARACLLFEDPLRPQFGAAFGEPTCEAAMFKLAAQIKEPNKYVEFNVNWQKDVRLEGDTGAFIDGCAVTFGGGLLDPENGGGDPGPKIGKLHMKRILKRGLVVDGFTPCNTAAGPGGTPTPGAPPPSAAPPTTTGPGPLPTSPRAPAGVLVGYLAKGNDAGACRLFSDSGKAAFAKAQGVADCPAAVAAFRTKITDPDRYGKPIGGDSDATARKGSYGTHDVDACKLNWSNYTVDGEMPPPGPQLGRMVVEHPPGNDGYWITGFSNC
ncbi:hypothetical protein AVR91_0204265 [Amycolatopsis keratiniphila subsp. keratiniphila]|uniref:Uncharacterized protein n=1 Tax=Amycolatopsis keratiniphila subsp. keratiniphila TaxID=227715 RepID=A0A1W2M330_9PSEU|nr:hypothetical protein AVR91_0204265 [Amycolatopsis keratiniphila subsp. keratiniphila]